MEHIKRMEKEFEKLASDIGKAETFLKNEKEEPKLTDEVQREFLSQQLYHMVGHREVLRDRIKYDKEKCGLGN